jgi:hypothetical protein
VVALPAMPFAASSLFAQYVTTIPNADVTNQSTTVPVPVEYNSADTVTPSFNPPNTLTPGSPPFPVGGNYDYLPNVVNQEDGTNQLPGAGGGANSLAAYEAQAVAARSFLYYQQPTNGGFIIDSVANQVYSSSTNAFAPTALEELATQLTDGIVLEYNGNQNTASTSSADKVTTGDVIVDGFFVAGAYPTASDPNFGMPTSAQSASGTDDPTQTENSVTYNRGVYGSNIAQSNRGFVNIGNLQDRGGLSQNGIDYLTTNVDPGTGLTFNYADALRYYYGADINLTVVSPTGTSTLITTSIPVETFGTDNGYFGNGVTNSSSNVNVSSIVVSHNSDNHLVGTGAVLEPYLGSQVLTITGGASAAFSYSDMSGLGPNSVQTITGTASNDLNLVGEAAANLNMPAIGTISYWVKVTSGAAATTDIFLNNDTTGVTTPGVPLTLVDDGQFHEYTFSLTDFPGITSGFQNDLSVNSIQFTGTGAVSLELDDLEYSETGVVPEPASLAMLPLAALLMRRRRAAKIE